MRGAILAGGTSSRFGGQPKGLEEVGGERIIDRVTQSLHGATGRPPILIANAPEANDWRPDLTVVHDAIRNCGSLGGIYTALMAGSGPVLVLAWDMPFVPVELLEEMVRRSEGCEALVAERADASGVEPLCAIYAPVCATPIRERIAEEDFRAAGFLDAVSYTKFSLDDVSRFGDPATIFFNVNTPAELTRAQELWRDLSDQ